MSGSHFSHVKSPLCIWPGAAPECALGSFHFLYSVERKVCGTCRCCWGCPPTPHYPPALTSKHEDRPPAPAQGQWEEGERLEKAALFVSPSFAVNHAPTAAIGFSSLRGCWCGAGAERASPDVPVREGGAGLGQGQRPKGGGGASPPPPLLSLHTFNSNQNPALRLGADRT